MVSVTTPEAALEHGEVAAFFDGVDEARRYVDRHLQDSERRCERLARMVQELVRPRSASDLAYWLSRQLCEAVGARGCTLLLRDPFWRAWRAGGQVGSLPKPEVLDAVLGDPLTSAGELHAIDGGLMLGLKGIDAHLGALWLEGVVELDARSVMLLLALCDTAGVLLDQGLKMEALNRDSRTGLPLLGAFLAQAASILPAEQASVLLGFRIVGLEAIREAQGGAAEERAMAELAAAVSEAMPDDALLGVRFDTVLVLRRIESVSAVEAQAADWAHTAILALRGRTSKSGPALTATAAYIILGHLPPDLMPHLDHLMRHLNDAPAGSAEKL